MNSQNKNLVSLSLRIGLAFVFIYAAVSSFAHPLDWIGYLPSFLRHNAHDTQLLKLFSTFEIILAVWLLIGRYTKYAALFSAAMLAGIVFSTYNQLIISFRDVGLFFAAIALYFSEK